ncbi:MAG: hydrolase TatD [Porticoccaceae bacterium]|nr:hydrolase TatD [Porticoccaceae bacterium]
MLVDSHCHLDRIDLEKAGRSLDQILVSAKDRGVTRFLSIATDLTSSERLLSLGQSYAEVYTSVGVHPLQDAAQPVPGVEELARLSDNDKVIAIGETGLDNHYAAETAEWQRASFISHLKAAREVAKPVIVHTRDARAETLALIREHGSRESAGILHCFTESWDMAEAALALNFYISFSGIVTFRNAEGLREVVRKVPLDRILVETDAPWLAPVPHRGQQNEPAYVVEVAEQVAALKGLSLEAFAKQSSENFDRLFGL